MECLALGILHKELWRRNPSWHQDYFSKSNQRGNTMSWIFIYFKVMQHQPLPRYISLTHTVHKLRQVAFLCSMTTQILVNCKWSAWTWGPCTKSYGGGTQTGSRTVSREATNGGAPCSGPSFTSKPCNSQSRPGVYSESTENNEYLQTSIGQGKVCVSCRKESF